MAHPLFAHVRDLFRGCCGYCGVSEVDCGGELTLDHFHPASAGGSESLENFVYACPRCNTYKGEFAPSPDDLASGRRVLHPLRDDTASHLTLNLSTGLLEAITPTGQFHMNLLRLNRGALVRHRLRARVIELSLAQLHVLREENMRMSSLLEKYEELIARLRQQLGLPER